MIRDNVNDYNKENKKKRRIAFLLLLVWVAYMPEMKMNQLFDFALSQYLPLFTYEQEFGALSVDYKTQYQVPAWFYEDEGEEAVNVDLAIEPTTESENADEKEVKETIGRAGDKAITYSREQLQNRDFLLQKIFVVDDNTSMTKEELSIENLLDKDLSVDMKEKEPKILIYHTHGSEAFADSREGKKEDTIIGVGSYLSDVLQNQYGVSVYHDETLYDVIDGSLDRSKAYEKAYENVSRILKENPSIEVVIDLHRDGVDEETHLVTEINEKPTAKIMFLNGVSRSNLNGEIDYLKNPNKLDNLAFSFQMFLKGKELYGDYVRKIYVRSLRYNLHLAPRTTLIEVGAQNNTIEEEKNAMEPLADILYKVLSKKEDCGTIE